MNSKIYVGLIVFILSVGLGVGINTKQSFIDDLDVSNHIEDSENKIVQLISSESFVDTYFDNSVANIDELMSNSPNILVVTPTNNRVNCSQSIISEVEIIEVLKGEYNIGDIVKVIEPCSFKYNKYFYSTGGYNLMRSGDKYLLLLENVVKPTENFKKNMKDRLLKPVSTLYGKYQLNTIAFGAINNEKLINQQISYNSVKDYDIIVTDNTIIVNYNDLRESLLKKLEM